MPKKTKNKKAFKRKRKAKRSKRSSSIVHKQGETWITFIPKHMNEIAPERFTTTLFWEMFLTAPVITSSGSGQYFTIKGYSPYLPLAIGPLSTALNAQSFSTPGFATQGSYSSASSMVGYNSWSAIYDKSVTLASSIAVDQVAGANTDNIQCIVFPFQQTIGQVATIPSLATVAPNRYSSTLHYAKEMISNDIRVNASSNKVKNKINVAEFFAVKHEDLFVENNYCWYPDNTNQAPYSCWSWVLAFCSASSAATGSPSSWRIKMSQRVCFYAPHDDIAGL